MQKYTTTNELQDFTRGQLYKILCYMKQEYECKTLDTDKYKRLRETAVEYATICTALKDW